jgi:ankyrin repeat protein
MSDNQQQRVDSATCDVVSDAIHGNVDAVRKWLHGDGQYDIKQHINVLEGAASEGHFDICQLVIDCDTVSTDDLKDVLRTACYYGHILVVQLIVRTLGHHCNTQLLDDCLHLAASRRHTEMVKWLLPLTHPTDADRMRWDLVQASARGSLTRVKRLVNDIGRDVTDVMSHALWTACYNGKFTIVDWLMTHTSADIKYSRMIYVFNSGMTSLAVACHEGHMTIVKRMLIDSTSSCDINTATGDKSNTALHDIIWHTPFIPLHVSCYRSDTAAVVDMVYESDVNIQDFDGKTAMHYACMNGHCDIVKVLLSVFADTDITDDDGYTPADVCEVKDNPDLADYIEDNNLMNVRGNDDSDNAAIADRNSHYAINFGVDYWSAREMQDEVVEFSTVLPPVPMAVTTSVSDVTTKPPSKQVELMDGQADGDEFVNSAEMEGLENEMEQEGVFMTEGQMWRQLAAETKKRADALQKVVNSQQKTIDFLLKQMAPPKKKQRRR